MPSLKSIDLIVRDVAREVAGLTVLQEFEKFAELDGGEVKILLSPDALVPIENASGVILHLEEADLAAAARRAEIFGALVLKGPLRTEWGTRSLLVQGPESIVIDFYETLPVAPVNGDRSTLNF